MTTPRLAQYVQPNLPEARIAHQWAKIANADYRRHTPVTRLLPALAVSLAVGFVIVLGWKHWHVTSPVALDGTAVESGLSGAEALTLPDGSRIELSPGSRLVIDEYDRARVLLTLKRGRAAFQVTHQTNRSFDIHASDVDISVIGTRFSVAVSESAATPSVTVHVEQGKVTVRNRQAAPDDRILAAGQSWSSGFAPAAPSSEVIAPSPAASEPPPDVASSVEPPAGGHSVTSSKSASESPKELFELAETLRINGKLRDSADALNRLRRSYRSDPRAGLAAFELGRMRMDIFGDLSGSIDALRDAVQLSPGASFREDAEARLVQLYNRQGNFGACQSAKSEYLRRFPHGAASTVVSQLCEH